jgi:hypothetical protein
LNSEVVTFGGTAQTLFTLIHVCKPGVNISGKDGNNGNFSAMGDGYVAGTSYVGGTMSIGGINNTYKLYVNGSIYSTADITAFSDQSVKNNIRPIDNVLERIKGSRGIIYDRTDIDTNDNIGFIAQELEVNFPELVTTNTDGTKAVKYQNMVAVLLEAIKEQQKQIDELKSK